MKRVTGARSICLDAAATDAEGVEYDIEVQRASDGARPKRARYHSSVMDVENLDAGQEFEELPTTYVIFITEKDVFEKGEPYYIIERTLGSDPLTKYRSLRWGRPFCHGAEARQVCECGYPAEGE